MVIGQCESVWYYSKSADTVKDIVKDILFAGDKFYLECKQLYGHTGPHGGFLRGMVDGQESKLWVKWYNG